MTPRLLPLPLALAATLAACNDDAQQGPPEALLDPKTCEECHPKHYRQWLGSMHAYAADDPIFLAMNARGQRETGGALGDFCIRCHAPVAVALGKTTDGLNLDELPQHLKGVTCYFCHNVESVEGTHNNPLVLAMDGIMRGELADAVANEVHESEYSPHLDDSTIASGQMCGSCHDIVNGHDVHLERTYKEWVDSFYDTPDPANPQLTIYFGNTCARCHMFGSAEPIADYEGVKSRSLRSHMMVGVDLALTDFPDAELGPQLVAEQTAESDRQRMPSVCAGLCVRPADGGGTDVVVWLHNEAQGHAWPSGATQDRRAWVELEAFDGDAAVVRTGVLADDEPVDAAAAQDPTLWVFRDYASNADGAPESMFWNITATEPNLLPIAAEAGLKYDKTTWRERSWHVDGPVDRARVQVNLRPIPHELVDELADEGLFDPAAIKARIRTNVAGSTQIEWTPDTAVMTDYEGPCVYSASCFCALANESGACE
ncbi:MAG: cytochrome c family protein [Nannocystaceae bacterium]|nr:cytochrome c family protein [Nannocystaceae bacterium]